MCDTEPEFTNNESDCPEVCKTTACAIVTPDGKRLSDGRRRDEMSLLSSERDGDTRARSPPGVRSRPGAGLARRAGMRETRAAFASALVGSLGGFVATLCVYPLDVARRDLARRGADGDASAASLASALASLVSEKGAAGLFEGIAPRAAQCLAEDFVFFWCAPRTPSSSRPPPSPSRGVGSHH